jgi:hypothetical protein
MGQTEDHFVFALGQLDGGGLRFSWTADSNGFSRGKFVCLVDRNAGD